MTSSLRIKNFTIDKFGDFSSNIDYNGRTDIFRDAISLIINQCDPRRPKGASGGHKVSASRAAQESEALVLYIKMLGFFFVFCLSELIEELASRREMKIVCRCQIILLG